MSKKIMDLKKKIELHYGQSPVKGATESMQKCLTREKEYCALYAQNDVPAQVHSNTNDTMLTKFGVHSDFAKENSYIRPFQVNIETELVDIGVMNANASTLSGSGYRVGGTFFDMSIAEIVLDEFQSLGYEIIKKHD